MLTAQARAAQIYRQLSRLGRLQVRWHRGWFLTYPYPAPRGYGVRGQFVAVYAQGAEVEWIEADLIEFATITQPSGQTSAALCSV